MGQVSAEMLKRARDLRKNATRQERKLWYEFLSKHPVRFRRQQPVGPYIVDFFCPSARLVIELDGGGHWEPEQYEYDRRRDSYLVQQKMVVLRFTNLDVDQNFSGVCAEIERVISPSVRCADSSPAGGVPECLLLDGGGGPKGRWG